MRETRALDMSILKYITLWGVSRLLIGLERLKLGVFICGRLFECSQETPRFLWAGRRSWLRTGREGFGNLQGRHAAGEKTPNRGRASHLNWLKLNRRSMGTLEECLALV